MTVLTVINGRLMLPDEYLKHLGIDESDKVSVERMPNGSLSLSAVRRRHSDLDGFIGSLHDPNQPVLSLEEIKRVTEDAWAGKR